MLLPIANLFGPENWLIIAVVALLLFGKRLPEVGRSLGKGIIEFKKGLQGIEEDITTSTTQPPAQQTRVDRPALTNAAPAPGHKFDPFTGKPLEPETKQMKFDPYTGKPLSEETANSQTESSI